MPSAVLKVRAWLVSAISVTTPSQGARMCPLSGRMPMQLPMTPEENMMSGICSMGTVSPPTGAVSGRSARPCRLPDISLSPAAIFRDLARLSRVKAVLRQAVTCSAERGGS